MVKEKEEDYPNGVIQDLIEIIRGIDHLYFTKWRYPTSDLETSKDTNIARVRASASASHSSRPNSLPLPLDSN